MNPRKVQPDDWVGWAQSKDLSESEKDLFDTASILFHVRALKLNAIWTECGRRSNPRLREEGIKRRLAKERAESFSSFGNETTSMKGEKNQFRKRSGKRRMFLLDLDRPDQSSRD